MVIAKIRQCRWILNILLLAALFFGTLRITLWIGSGLSAKDDEPGPSVQETAAPPDAAAAASVAGALSEPPVPDGAALASPVIPAPDQAGPYGVGHYSAAFEKAPYGTYKAEVYYPAMQDGRLSEADRSGAPYPGIVASNGFLGSDWNFTWVPRQMASHGYVTICFTPPSGGTLNTWTLESLARSMDTTQWAAGFAGGVQELMRQNSLPDSPVSGLLAGKFGAIGLSIGGGGALEAAGTGADFDAVVALAPAYADLSGVDGFCELLAQSQNPWAGSVPEPLCQLFDRVDLLGFIQAWFADIRTATANIAAPALLETGSEDGFIPPSWVQAAYRGIPETTRKACIEIRGGSHAAFTDEWVLGPGDAIERLLGGGLAIDASEQHRISQEYYVSWFNYYLKGQAEYGAYISGSAMDPDVGAGVLSAARSNSL